MINCMMWHRYVNDFGTGPTMPAFYLRTLSNDTAADYFAARRRPPDVVVVNLGTNDGSTRGTTAS